MCIHQIKGNLYNYQHVRVGKKVHSIYLGPVSGTGSWIRKEIGEVTRGWEDGMKAIHEPPIKLDKVTLQQLKQSKMKDRKNLVKDICKVTSIRIPGSRVTTFFNGAGEIINQSFRTEDGRTWEIPGANPEKLRERIYTSGSMRHPAKMNPLWSQAMIQKYSKPGDTILDPMAGIGTTGIEAARLGRNVIMTELEEKWTNQVKKNVKLLKNSGQLLGRVNIRRGDARSLKLHKKVDVIMFSPPYGHTALEGQKDRKKLMQYSAYSKSKDNIGMKAGNQYFEDMRRVYSSCYQNLKRKGIIVVNTKNRVENFKEVRFDQQTRIIVESCGFKLIEKKRVPAKPNIYRLIYEKRFRDYPRIHHEDILVFQKG